MDGYFIKKTRNLLEAAANTPAGGTASQGLTAQAQVYSTLALVVALTEIEKHLAEIASNTRVAS
jgi:hypothetical protein